MILKELSDHIKSHDRIEETLLLKHFQLTQNGLAPMIEVLLRRGNIKKIIDQRGGVMASKTYYSWNDTPQIPMVNLI